MITLFGLSPFWMWTAFLAVILIFLWIDLSAFNKKDHVVEVKESLLWVSVWVTMAMIFFGIVWWQIGQTTALEFLTGYLIEYSLSMDNLFVFLMIFTAFNIPRIYQHRILFWGIVGAIIMRGLFIAIGATLVAKFKWIFLLFAFIVLVGAWHMQFQKEKKFDPKKSKAVRIAKWFFPVTDKTRGHDFFIKIKGRHYATIFFLTLVTIEMTDVIFATDSIPAIFAITTDPFIVFSSNIFAILGLRALYFSIAGLHSMFAYLKTGLAAILAFVGVKMIFIGLPAFLELLGMDPHLVPEIHIPVMLSLIVIVGILALSIVASIFFAKGGKDSHKLLHRHEEGHVRVQVHRKHVKELHK